jgi:hypothetical protein
MNLRNFFTELKQRNVYRIAFAYGGVAWLLECRPASKAGLSVSVLMDYRRFCLRPLSLIALRTGGARGCRGRTQCCSGSHSRACTCVNSRQLFPSRAPARTGITPVAEASNIAQTPFV